MHCFLVKTLTGVPSFIQWAILMTDHAPQQTFLHWEHFDRIFLKEQLAKGKNISFLGHGNGLCTCCHSLSSAWLI